MPDGETIAVVRRLRLDRICEFDGDAAVSEAKACFRQDARMKTEIAARRAVVASVNELAFVVDGQGYRHAAALLLEVASVIDRILITD